MPTTVATSTQARPLGYPSQAMIDRNPGNGLAGTANPGTGHLYAMARNTAGSYELFRSTDGGATWGSFTTLVRAAVQEWSGIWIDDRYWLHWCYRVNEAGMDKLLYRRCNLKTGAWQPETFVADDPNGGVPGSVWSGLDIVVHRRTNNTYAVVVAGGRTIGGNHGAQCMSLSISAPTSAAPNGVVTLTNGMLAGSRLWTYNGSGRITPSIELEHTGDGRTASLPHLWLTFGRATLRMVKLAWNGNGWTGPTTTVLVKAGLAAQNAICGRWDGDRFCMAVPNPDPNDTDTVSVFERNRANSVTTLRRTPEHPQGVIRACTAVTNPSDRRLRVYATGTTTADLYFTDLNRATGLWTAWTLVITPTVAVLGAGADQFTARRVSSTARYDLLTAHATPSPNTVVHTRQPVTFVPNTPTWNVAATGYNSGQAADVNAALPLTWRFMDPDPGETQSAYALSRQIGVGALQYWRASDSTWQPAEVKNPAATTVVTLPTGWALAADAPYSYRVKVWDSADAASVYSDAIVLIPSAKVNPVITAPTAAQVLTTDTVAVAWTAAEQTAWRVTLATSPGGAVVHDSGWQVGADAVYTVPYRLPDLTGWTVTLRTLNLESMASDTVTVAFTVDYLEPAPPTTVATPNPAGGVITVAITNPAPSGGNSLTNPSFEANTTGWATVNATITRSNAQSHDGIWSVLLTPDGIGLDPRVENTAAAQVPATPGQQWTVDVWIRPATANKSARVGINWFDAAGVFLSASTVTVPVTAGVWQLVTLTAAAPALTAKAGARAGLTGTPATTDTAHIDDVRLAPAGGQPGLADQDLYRRPITRPNIHPNSDVETDLTGWSGVNAAITRSTAQAHAGTASILVTPTGSGVVARAESTTATGLPVSPGDPVTVDAWIRPATATKPVAVQVTWRDAGGGFLSSDVVTVPPLPGVWQYLSITVACPDNGATVANAAAGLGATPATTDTCHVDELRLSRGDPSDGIRIAAGLRAGAVVGDWRAVSGVDYEYRVIARATNGTSSAGPWAA